MSTLQLFLLLATLSILQLAISLQYTNNLKSSVPSSTRLYYDFLKKTGDGKAKDPKRLLKNILFPGIYREYEDTVEVKATIKIDTKKEIKSRNTDVRSFQSQESKSGSYVSADEKSAPRFIDAISFKEQVLKPIQKPADFVPTAQAPKKGTIANVGGVSVLPNIKTYPRTSKPIILYEYEGSGDCRRVREACSILDINVDFRPCPGGTRGYSDQQATITLGGKRQVPFMIDTNGMVRNQILGANDIINYLFESYGPGAAKVPGNLKNNGVSFGGGKGNVMRSNSRPDFMKIKPLTLYGYEGVAGVKQVREVLTELGISHLLINCANGSDNRQKLISKKGFFDVPYIVDPNTGVELFNAGDIVKYLEKTYTI